VAQLARLSGRTVVFHTGVALVNARTGRAQVECIDVASTYRPLSAGEIDQYLRRERPYDCAGSVRSEGLGIALFERIVNDDPSALVGLPLITVARMLRAEGVDVLAGSGA
jgi:septum formation protein